MYKDTELNDRELLVMLNQSNRLKTTDQSSNRDRDFQD